MTWTLQQLINYVYTETNRPDLVAETQSAIISAVQKLHTLEFFYGDLREATVVFDTPAYIQQLDVSAVPRFRAISHFRKWDPSFQQFQINPTLLPPLGSSINSSSVSEQIALGFIKLIPPDAILDDYMTERVDIGYMAGTVLNIKSSTKFQQGFLGWYEFPNIDIENNFAGFTSWIADKFPFAIIYSAAQSVLRKTGFLDAANQYGEVWDLGMPVRGELGQHTYALRINNTTVEGR